MAVNVVITGLGADFTALGSFGSADIFAENLVHNPMPIFLFLFLLKESPEWRWRGMDVW
jgi:hypothetical protein